jgi:hypothetical protein
LISLFSNTLILPSRDQVSHPCKTTARITSQNDGSPSTSHFLGIILPILHAHTFIRLPSTLRNFSTC